MYCFNIRQLVLLLLLLTAIIFQGGCGAASDSGSDDSAIELLREIQAELVELRAENNELRENNDALLRSIEEIRENEAVESDPAPVPPAAENPPASEGTNTASDNIVVEIHLPQPSPTPTPSPTPEPASLIGRWVTVGASRDGTSIPVPPEQSMEIEFFANGNGIMSIENTGNLFTWTGGDTGAIGRIVMNFTGSFGYGSSSETMTYQITGTQMGLTHTMFDESITTLLVKAE